MPTSAVPIPIAEVLPDGKYTVKQDPREIAHLWTPKTKRPGVWQRCGFTVPADVSDERVYFMADKYMNSAGKTIEKRGYRVLYMERPRVDNDWLTRGTTDPDRRAYVFWAFITRPLTTAKFEVKDESVPAFLKAGAKLA